MERGTRPGGPNGQEKIWGKRTESGFRGSLEARRAESR